MSLIHTRIDILFFSSSLSAQQASVLVWRQRRLCVWCHVVTCAPCHVCCRGWHGPPGPVEPQQWHWGVCILCMCVCVCVNVANTGRDGCGLCVISLCVDVRVFGVLRACCWASARTTQPNIQDFSLPSTPPPPVPPHPSQHTHNSRFPRGRFPQTLL